MIDNQETIPLDMGNLYLVLTETQDSDGFGFQVYDKLEHTEDNVFLSCLLRGMIEYSLKNTEECVNRGAKAFKRDYASMENTDDASADLSDASDVLGSSNVISLSTHTKTVGSA